MNKLFLAAGACLSVLTGLADVVVDWDAENPSFAYGTMTLEGGKVKTLAPSSGDEDLVFTGDALTFAAGATMTVFGRNVRFENAVASEGTLSFASGRSASYVTNCVGQGLPVKAPVVLFANAPGSLADYQIVSADMCGAASGAVATPYHQKTDGDGIVVQMQAVHGSTWMKLVWVRLSKDGDNILIELQKGGYAARDLFGSDFDVTPCEPREVGTALVSDVTYGLKSFTMKRTATDAVTCTGGFTPGGAVGVAAAVDFRIVQAGSVTFAQPFGGAGNFGFSGVLNDAKTTFSADTDKLPYASWTSWFVLAENALLTDVTAEDLAVTVAGSSYGTGVSKNPTSIVRFVNNGTNATFQAQGKPASLKGVLVSLRQNRSNIEMRVDEARYISSSYGPKIGDDLSSANPQSGSYGYGSVYADTVSLKAKTVDVFTMPVGVTNTWQDGTLTIGSSDGARTYYTARSRTAWPKGENALVDILPGATVSVSNSSFVGGYGTIRLHPGAQLIQEGYIEFDFTLSPYQKIVSDNGLIWFGYGCTVASTSVDKGAKTAGSTYVNDLELSNGARCIGSAVRTGTGPLNAVFSASGTGTSYFDTGISIVGTTSGDPQGVEFHADAGAELDIGGVVTLFNNASGRKAQVSKTGAGLVRFNAAVNFGNATAACNSQPATQLKEGGLVLGVSDCTSADLAFDFAGGGLVAAAGTTNTVGTVALKTTGAITLEAGSSLAIASAPEADWADGTGLAVSGDLKRASLRFGTSSSALTTSQLRKIRVNGLRAKLDDDGYLHGYKPGYALILR